MSLPRPVAASLWLLLFALAALLNAGGYRFGASDQAFYIPAVARHADPSLFPRDWTMLGAQDQLNAFTPLAGFLVGTVGVPLPALFLALYLVTLVALGLAGLAFARRLGGRSTWTAIAILFALSLRHAVALGAVNTLEGYTHPRMLAFAAGVLALAALLGGRRRAVVALVALAGVVHPTTALWFAAVAGVGLMVAHERWRPWLAASATLLAAASAWALLAGPLAPRLVHMDADWLAVLAGKRYLFPDRWPVSAWVLVGVYAAVIGAVHWHRRRSGLVSGAEAGLVLGVASLLVLFGISVPLDHTRVAFVVQLQVPRVLWIADLLAVTYAVWVLCEWKESGVGGQGSGVTDHRSEAAGAGSPGGARKAEGRAPDTRARVVALVIVAVALGRGVYVSVVEHPGRPVAQVGLPDTDWNRALRWIEANTPHDALVVADPAHAWRHGTSVRVGARRDVLLEEVKDSAMALYSRDSALRVLDRVQALQGFEALTTERARALGVRYGAGVLVIDRDLDLPLRHREGAFRIYALEQP